MILLSKLGFRIIAITLVVVLIGVTVLAFILNKKTKKPACAKPEKDKCISCKLHDSCKLFNNEE